MKIYDWRLAPNPRRVRMFLSEKGLDVPLEEVGEGMRLKAEFVARFDPYATTPTLELDDGTCIGEAMAICRYFEDLHPEPRLMGRDAKEKAIVEMWERRAYEGCDVRDLRDLRNTHPAFAQRRASRHRRADRAGGEHGRARPRAPAAVLGELGQAAREEPLHGRRRVQCRGHHRVLRARLPGPGARDAIAAEHANLRRWFADVGKRPSVSASA